MRPGRTLVLASLLALTGAALGAAAAWWFFARTPPPDPTAGTWPAVVTTVAGRGVPGSREGAWGVAAFSDPFAVAVAPDGRIYVADAGDNNRIRRIERDGGVVTLAGGAGEGHRDGPRGLAAFHTPSGLALAPDGTLFIADTGTHLIRRITPEGVVTTLAGTGAPGFGDGAAHEAMFDGPMGLALRADGTLLVADAYNNRIRAIDPRGMVTTLAGGSGLGAVVDGAAAIARFDTPCGVAVTRDGVVYVTDTGNSAIRRISPAGEVTTLALSPLDPNDDVSLFRPIGIAAGNDGRLVVTDRRGRVLQVWPDGRARVLAGSLSGFADGSRPAARFNNPTGVAVDARGAVIVADAGNFLVRRVAPAGLYPPDPPRSPLAPAPGLPRDALTSAPLPWPVDPQFAWHEVAGTIGEARGSAGGGRERFHAGIDVQADEGTEVRAVQSAKVEEPMAAAGFGALNESVTIGPFTYVHLRVGRDRRDESLGPATFPVDAPDPAGLPGRVRVRRGTRFAVGDAIGTVNRFAHVHLNAGSPGREVNPLTLPLVAFVDTVPPTIAPHGVTLFDEAWTPQVLQVHGRVVVHGRVRIVVDAWDQVDGNEPRRRLGLYRVAYQVLEASGAPIAGFERPETTIVFDRLPPDARAASLIYAEGTGITVYGNRQTRFLYVATTRVADGEVSDHFWDVSALLPGEYTLRVTVADASGNETSRDVPVFVYR